MIKCNKGLKSLKQYALPLLLFIAFFSLPLFCVCHNNEHPSHKYSREANEHFQKNPHEIHNHKHHEHHDHHTQKENKQGNTLN